MRKLPVQERQQRDEKRKLLTKIKKIQYKLLLNNQIMNVIQKKKKKAFKNFFSLKYLVLK